MILFLPTEKLVKALCTYLRRNMFPENPVDKSNHCYEVSPHSYICPYYKRECRRRCTGNFPRKMQGKSVVLLFSVIHWSHIDGCRRPMRSKHQLDNFWDGMEEEPVFVFSGAMNRTPVRKEKLLAKLLK